MRSTLNRKKDSPMCPLCTSQMEKREAMFFWRGDWKPGWVCVGQHGLWAVAGEEIAPLKGTGI